MFAKNFKKRGLTFARHNIIIELCQTKERSDKVSPRTGRPTENPRPNKLSIRISNEDKQILEDYCERENVNRTEAISRGIKKLDKK
nr:MAG TPA: hypothetical protein [Bacteriophage sp.]